MINHQQVELTKLLASRLERLSVDSTWSHRASGLRGNLLKVLEKIVSGLRGEETQLAILIEKGFEILRNAALEIPDLGALKSHHKLR